MIDETDNHTIRLLHEMRAETNSHFDSLERRLAGLERRIDGNTVLLSIVAGEHDRRITALESKAV